MFIRHYKITDKHYRTTEMAGLFNDEDHWNQFEKHNTRPYGKWISIEIQKTIPYESNL